MKHYGFTLLLMLDSLRRFFLKHGSAWKCPYFVPGIPEGIFLGTGIGLQVPQSKACSLPKKTNEAVNTSRLSLSFRPASCSSSSLPVQCLCSYPLIRPKRAGTDASQQGMELSAVPPLSRPDQPAAVSLELWEGISWLYLFLLKVH